MAAAGFGGKWHWIIIAQSVILGVAIGTLLATWKTRRGVDAILNAHFPGWDNLLSGKQKCGQCGIVMPEGKTRCRSCAWESPAREAANLKS